VKFDAFDHARVTEDGLIEAYAGGKAANDEGYEELDGARGHQQPMV
jgi:hypothetical protein